MHGPEAKRVLITGASSGIGLATALHLADAGYFVIAGVRDPKHNGEIRTARLHRHARIQVMGLDVTNDDAIRAAVERSTEKGAPLFALVSNAGINIRGYFEDLSTEEMRRVFDVNLFGAMKVIAAVLPHMRAARRGRIVCISSIGGRIASPASSAYCSSKFALEGFGESIYQEIRPFGIHFSLIEPGFVHTELFGKNRKTAADAMAPHSAYHPWFRCLERLTDHEVKRSRVTAQCVAQTVQRALSEPRPRLRYVVGRRARTLLRLRRHLPGELFDRVLIREVLRRIETTSAR